MTNRVHFLAGGISFGRSKGTSGSEADDEAQLTCYTEQDRSRRRSKGNGGLGKVWGRLVGGGPGKRILCLRQTPDLPRPGPSPADTGLGVKALAGL